MKVLIAGDDPVSRRVLEATLPNWGYEPVAAEDGLAASEAMQDDEVPRVSVLDWTTPRFNGIGLCRRIRDSIRVPPTYITLLRAWGGREDVTKGLEAGANGYVSKPFDRDELRALAHRRAHPEPAEQTCRPGARTGGSPCSRQATPGAPPHLFPLEENP